MSRTSFLLSQTLAGYYGEVAFREPPLLAALRRETEALPEAQMQIAPEQGRLLWLLAKLMGAQRAIEVGVFTGYSGFCVASALPADGYLLACDINAEWTAIARRYWRQGDVADKVELRLAPALETLQAELASGQGGSYDFAFIDADKTNYLAYYEHCLQLLRPGGLVAVDNVLWGGRVADAKANDADTRALRAFNQQLAQDERVEFCMVPIADGLSLCRKRE